MWGFTAIVLAGVLIDSLLQQLFLGILSIDNICLEKALVYCGVKVAGPKEFSSKVWD